MKKKHQLINLRISSIGILVASMLCLAVLCGMATASQSWVPPPLNEKNAIVGGRVSNSPRPLYICRANHNGNIHPGKLAFYDNRWSCFIGNGGGEQRYETYEILTATDPENFHWTTERNTVPKDAIAGGRVSDSPRPLYICRANHNGNLHPGKLAFYNGRWSCFIGNGGREERYEQYEALNVTKGPDGWLEKHPAIAERIVWEDDKGAHSWPNWKKEWKAELQQAFDMAMKGGSIPLADVPSNCIHMDDSSQYPYTILNPNDAWGYFKSSVAQSLAIEIKREVSWSVLDYSPQQLAQIFDSRQMFLFTTHLCRGYKLHDYTWGFVTPAPPLRSHQFLQKNGLIGTSALDTVALVLNWSRDNLIHYLGYATYANMEDQWQYRGFPPVIRVLNGTAVSSQPGSPVRNRTAGCSGTVGLYRVLLRAVNIPVAQIVTAGNAQPHFMSISRYLSHGDDPYGGYKRATPPIPAVEMLIDQQKFDTWFGAGVSETAKANNVGRRSLELAITFLPNDLLRDYCKDTAAGKSHAQGDVLKFFQRVYTAAQLEEQNLWGRMDGKIAGLGGCSNIPRP